MKFCLRVLPNAGQSDRAKWPKRGTVGRVTQLKSRYKLWPTHTPWPTHTHTHIIYTLYTHTHTQYIQYIIHTHTLYIHYTHTHTLAYSTWRPVLTHTHIYEYTQ